MTVASPDFRASRCTRYRYRYSTCTRCTDACPHEAVTLSDEGAALDPARCQNCALCISACRTGAWTSGSFKPIDLLRQAIKRPAWRVACAPSGESADAIVPCLGAIDGVTLAYLAKRRIPTTLHGSWQCTACSHGASGAAQLRLNLEALDVLHEAATKSAGAGVATDWLMPIIGEDPRAAGTQHNKADSAAFTPARRQLFRRLIGRGVDEVVRAATLGGEPAAVAEKAIRAGSYALTEQRELLQIVCKQKEDRPFEARLHAALPLMQLTLKAGCTLCEACFRVCPTGALQIEENPGDWALTFQIDRCVACEACLEVCQPRVLDAAAVFDARSEQPARVLLSLNKQRCARCDRYFVSPSPEKTCPVCCDDEDAFSAIFG